jgi:hypothetical protein
MLVNWEAIGAVGEILGALVVVATLVYLAAQVRESRRATAADIYQSRATSRADAELQIALNCPTYYEIHFRFLEVQSAEGVDAALASLSKQERFLVSRYYDSLMVRFDNVCFQYNQGFIPDSYFENNKIGMRRFGPVWRRLGLTLPPDLDRVLCSVLDEDPV